MNQYLSHKPTNQPNQAVIYRRKEIMKTTFYGVWNINTKKFETDDKGQLLMFWTIREAKESIEKIGRWRGQEVIRRIMDIRITITDNPQIIDAIYIKT